MPSKPLLRSLCLATTALCGLGLAPAMAKTTERRSST